MQVCVFIRKSVKVWNEWAPAPTPPPPTHGFVCECMHTHSLLHLQSHSKKSTLLSSNQQRTGLTRIELDRIPFIFNGILKSNERNSRNGIRNDMANKCECISKYSKHARCWCCASLLFYSDPSLTDWLTEWREFALWWPSITETDSVWKREEGLKSR